MQESNEETRWGNTVKFIDKLEDAERFFGCEDLILTDENIEMLKSGKIINAGIMCDEYAITIRYQSKENDSNEIN